MSELAKEILKLQVVVAVTNWTRISEEQIPTPTRTTAFQTLFGVSSWKMLGYCLELATTASFRYLLFSPLPVILLDILELQCYIR